MIPDADGDPKGGLRAEWGLVLAEHKQLQVPPPAEENARVFGMTQCSGGLTLSDRDLCGWLAIRCITFPKCGPHAESCRCWRSKALQVPPSAEENARTVGMTRCSGGLSA